MKKACTKCGVEKSLEDFYTQKAGRFGRGSYCKACTKKDCRKRQEANPEKHRAQEKAWRVRNSEKLKCAALKRRYGLTLDRYNGLMATQKHRCAACNRKFGEELPPKVDHCHSSGHVRGILCNACNVSEGALGTPERVLALYRYMTKNELFYKCESRLT